MTNAEILDRMEKRLAGAPRFSTKDAALDAAIHAEKNGSIEGPMVVKNPGGAYIIIGWKDYEVTAQAGRAGYDYVYAPHYIERLAKGEHPSEEDNEGEIELMLGANAADERRNRRAGVQKARTYEQLREGK